jgi:hypothetical protein
LLSVTGYGLSEWNRRWQRFLREPVKAAPDASAAPAPPMRAQRELGRRARLADLLDARGYGRESASEVEPLLTTASRLPQVRERAARGLYRAGDDTGAERALGAVTEIDGLYGPWFALAGRGFKRRGQLAESESAFTLGLSVDPLSEEVACEGYSETPNPAAATGTGPGGANVTEPPLPTRPTWSELCKAARSVPRD